MQGRTNILSTNRTATAVLVHGALIDASVWTGVAAGLQAAGHTAVAGAREV